MIEIHVDSRNDDTAVQTTADGRFRVSGADHQGHGASITVEPAQIAQVLVDAGYGETPAHGHPEPRMQT